MRSSLLSRFTVFSSFPVSIFQFLFVLSFYNILSFFYLDFFLYSFFNLCHSLLLCTHTHTRTNTHTDTHAHALTYINHTPSLPLGQSISFLSFTISPFLLFYFISFLLSSYSFWSISNRC